ncbi:MAG: AEC family transporter [Promicromonosporaceae bacterium]|nr:AEC family transporter [Promicromonosporaceae bacterium]
MIGLFSGFFTLFLIALLGYIARKNEIIGPNAEKDLNRLVFYFALPSMTFASIINAERIELFNRQILVQALVMGAAVACYGVANMLLPGRRETGSAGVIAATSSYYANLGNIGMPVMIVLFGDPSIMVPYLLLQQIIFAPISLGLLEYLATRKLAVGTLLMMPLKNPLIMTAIIGVTLRALPITIPEVFITPFQSLGAGSVPMVMFAFGAGLVGKRLREDANSRVIFATVTKSILMPLFAVIIASAFGLTHREMVIATVVAALPTAGNVYNFAVKFDTGVNTARRVVLLTTVISPIVILLLSAILTV